MIITIEEEMRIMNDDLLWEKVLKRIKEEVNSLLYTTWFESTKLKRVDGNKFVILVPTEIHRKHLFDKYYELILAKLLKETKEVEEVSFALEDEFKEDNEDVGYNIARY